jgi:hypothetical protein
VWIADIRRRGPSLFVHDLLPVQALKGVEDPFERLALLLQDRNHAAAAIDAPFSLPRGYVSGDDHKKLLERVRRIETDHQRPFPESSAIIRNFAPELGQNGAKIFRETESMWRRRRINVRSTLWDGPRKGTAMTVACLYLLATAEAPLWPWSQGSELGLVVEAFPAAQLAHWNLPYQEYSGNSKPALDTRKTIINGTNELKGISDYIEFGQFDELTICNADALDAVICALAAVAVTDGAVAFSPTPASKIEGWIAVHSGHGCDSVSDLNT